MRAVVEHSCRQLGRIVKRLAGGVNREINTIGAIRRNFGKSFGRQLWGEAAKAISDFQVIPWTVTKCRGYVRQNVDPLRSGDRSYD